MRKSSKSAQTWCTWPCYEIQPFLLEIHYFQQCYAINNLYLHTYPDNITNWTKPGGLWQASRLHQKYHCHNGRTCLKSVPRRLHEITHSTKKQTDWHRSAKRKSFLQQRSTTCKCKSCDCDDWHQQRDFPCMEPWHKHPNLWSCSICHRINMHHLGTPRDRELSLSIGKNVTWYQTTFHAEINQWNLVNNKIRPRASAIMQTTTPCEVYYN